jgi:hypothetical protein
MDTCVWTLVPVCVACLSVFCAFFVSRAHIAWTHRPAHAACSHTKNARFSSNSQTLVGTAYTPATYRARGGPLAPTSHRKRMHGALATKAGDSGTWVSLQHVQHQIYFCNIQIKQSQHTSETTKHLQHISERHTKCLKTLKSHCKHI